MGVERHAVKHGEFGRKAPIGAWDIFHDKDSGLYWFLNKDPNVPPVEIGTLDDLLSLQH